MGKASPSGADRSPGAKARQAKHFNLGYTNAANCSQLQRYGIDQASLGEFIQALIKPKEGPE